ncbi:MAG: hypothetical protein QM776_05815 [Rhodocyclaceae bacterium]
MAAVLLLSSSLALAEVSDKAPSVAKLWLMPIALCALAVFIGRARKRWAIILLTVICLALAYSTYDLVSDPYVGPALLAEQGTMYIGSAYCGAIVSLTGCLIGALLAFRGRGKTSGV